MGMISIRIPEVSAQMETRPRRGVALCAYMTSTPVTDWLNVSFLKFQPVGGAVALCSGNNSNCSTYSPIQTGLSSAHSCVHSSTSDVPLRSVLSYLLLHLKHLDLGWKVRSIPRSIPSIPLTFRSLMFILSLS